LDKFIKAGVRVLKIEGRARGAEYVKRVVECYDAAVKAMERGEYTPEYAAELKAGVSEVFNRGFWDGYYQGARLGEWSDVYGSKATKKKTYVGKVTNYFANIGVAEILVETGEINVGQNILIIGPSTGVIEMQPSEIRVDLEPAQKAVKGVKCSIAVPERLRRSDKVYIFE
jgi:putative protease